MVKARETILRLGGVEKTNTFTRLYLTFLGQLRWDQIPVVPPEVVLLPRFFYFNIYEISYWSRAILIPLSIIYALKPDRSLPESMHITELFTGAPMDQHDADLVSWRGFFTTADRAMRLWEKVPLKPLRRMAMKRAEDWMVRRSEDSDGLGAIFPSMVNCVMALKCLGYDESHPAIASNMAKLEELEIEDGDRLRLQPCLSPVWDTVLAMNALGEAGYPGDTVEMVEAARWVLTKEVRKTGDWQYRVPQTEASGWYFQFANEFYPDIDDTAAVLLALDHVPSGSVEGLDAAMGRGFNWILRMQSSDGGWAAFDVDVVREALTQVPYADHNAMLDPPCPDITGRVLEAIGRFSETPRRAPRSASDSRGRRVPKESARTRRLMVRALGGQLRLRYMAGVEGADLCRRRAVVIDGAARRGLAKEPPERRRRLGRRLRFVRRFGTEGQRPEHVFADSVGRHGIGGRRRRR